MFSFRDPPTPTRLRLLPMLDLMLVVVLLAWVAYGSNTLHGLAVIPKPDPYTGGPRLVTVLPDRLMLNGEEMAPTALLLRLVEMTDDGGDTVVLEPGPGANAGRLVEVVQLLGAAGFSSVILVRGAL